MKLVLLWASFVIACHYYGVGVNLSFLCYSLAGPVILLLSAGPNGLLRHSQQAPVVLAGCLVSMALLTVHYQWLSLSPDTSFAPSLALAALPLWALVTRLVDGWRLLTGLAWIVLAFAAWSTARYLLVGERAYAPLSDPNSYVALLYLAWLPWQHARLAHDSTRSASHVAISGAATFVTVSAMLATQSRFALLVIGGVLAYWLIASRFRGICTRSFLTVVVSTAFAGLLHLGVGGEQTVVTTLTEDFASDGPSHRGMLLESAWDAIVGYGGLTGAGVYTFSLLYPRFRSLHEQSTAGVFVHNDYVQLFLEGGVLLALPLLVLALATAVRVWRLTFSQGEWKPEAGAGLGLGVALAHANVNFVIYTLPLVVLMGVLLSLAFGERQGAGVAANLRVRRATIVLWCVGALLLVGTWSYAALDAFTYGVFSGQRGVPGVADLRADQPRVLEFSRFAQRMNGERGVPVLGEARLLELSLGDAPGQTELDRVAAVYDRALVVDPWNPLGYVNYFDFLARHPGARGAFQPETLANEAVRLDPTRIDAALRAVVFNMQAGNPDAAEHISVELLQWCELFARRQREDLDRMGRALTQLNERLGSDSLGHALESCRSAQHRTRVTRRTRTTIMRWLMPPAVGP